jgi:murein DD-endopeptidase MepM/ murein hydrolase activator NlpD
MTSPIDILQTEFSKINPVGLDTKADTMFIFSNIENFQDDISYKISYGSLSKKIKHTKVELPFPKGKKYRIIQGNSTNYTHNTNYSRFAIDFNLKVNDTISSATDGYVVGVIDQYKYGGKDKKWRPFGNSITIYNPNSGYFLQYVHLTCQGSFVKVGDNVKRGQPIGLSAEQGRRILNTCILIV